MLAPTEFRSLRHFVTPPFTKGRRDFLTQENYMTKRLSQLKPRQHIFNLFVFTIVLLYITAFIYASPMEIIRGMKAIIEARDVLITDYMVGVQIEKTEGAATLSLQGEGVSFILRPISPLTPAEPPED